MLTEAGDDRIIRFMELKLKAVWLRICRAGYKQSYVYTISDERWTNLGLLIEYLYEVDPDG